MINQGPPPTGPATHALYEVNISTHDDVDDAEVRSRLLAAFSRFFGSVEKVKLTIFEIRRNEATRQARIHALVDAELVEGAEPVVIEFALRDEGFGVEYQLTFEEKIDVTVKPYHPSQRQ